MKIFKYQGGNKLQETNYYQKPDNTRVASNAPLPLTLKPFYKPYMKFLYDGIFTGADAIPFEYIETQYNPNETGVTWEHINGNRAFRKRFLSSEEAKAFQEKKLLQEKVNNFRSALRNKYQHGGPVRFNNVEPAVSTYVAPRPQGVASHTLPYNFWDFVPVVSTYRAAKRIDMGDPNASFGDLLVNGAMDALGFGMVGPVVKAASKFRKIDKALKSRGFINGSEEGIYIRKNPTGAVNRVSGNVKQIPVVDYTSAVQAPLVQTLRVPFTAPFKGNGENK